MKTRKADASMKTNHRFPLLLLSSLFKFVYISLI